MKVPKRLYHITHTNNLDGIRRDGLVPCRDYIFAGWDDMKPGVSLVSHPNRYPLRIQPWQVILTIHTEALNPAQFIYLGSGWYRYEGNIEGKEVI